MSPKKEPTIKTCYKCGNTSTFDHSKGEKFWRESEYQTIKLGYQGYGSCMEGSIIEFMLCSKCLYEFIKTFTKTAQDRVLNSGDNKGYTLNEWK